MPRTKPKSPHRKKFKLLLDSAFATPELFPRLSKRANVKHCVYDYGLPSQAEDKDIYQLAVQEMRFVLTVDFHDFRKLVQKGKVGVLGIDSHLSNVEVDELVSEFIRGKNPDEYMGSAIRIKADT